MQASEWYCRTVGGIESKKESGNGSKSEGARTPLLRGYRRRERGGDWARTSSASLMKGGRGGGGQEEAALVSRVPTCQVVRVLNLGKSCRTMFSSQHGVETTSAQMFFRPQIKVGRNLGLKKKFGPRIWEHELSRI